MLPTVAIIGRPNVGKSTLFNRLVGKKLALVDDTPGVTRDRREGEGRLFDLEFTIVDTAGYEDEDPGYPARSDADADRGGDCGRAGRVVPDRWTCQASPRSTRKSPVGCAAARTPVVLAVNKAEGKQGDNGIFESYALGFGDPIAISGEHGEGMADLFQALLPHIDGGKFEEIDSEAPDAILKTGHCRSPQCGQIDADQQAAWARTGLITGPEAGITRDSISVDWIWTDPNPKQGASPMKKAISPRC